MSRPKQKSSGAKFIEGTYMLLSDEILFSILNIHMVYFTGGILKLVGLEYTKQLQPTERILYNFAASIQKQFKQHRKRAENYKMRINKAVRFNENFGEVLNGMNSVTRNFFLSQMRNHNGSKYKYEFTLEDKLLVLSLQKRSAKTYRFLSSLFILPSRETLRKLLNAIDIDVGIHVDNMNFLAEKVQSMNEHEQMFCILMFDEIRLRENVQYNKSKDLVTGFVDEGFNWSPELANCAMVWKLQGIHGQKPWKQPVAFTLYKGTCSFATICQYYKEIVKLCLKAGIHIVVSVCDQGSTNVRAMSHMMEMSRQEAFRNG